MQMWKQFEGHTKLMAVLICILLGGIWGPGQMNAQTALQGPTFFSAQPDVPREAKPIAHMVEDAMGMLWIGGKSGLFRYDGQSWQAISSPDTSLSRSVTCLHLDTRGQLWVGHENGQISQKSGDSLRKFIIEPDFLSQPITGLYRDQQDRLWIACYGEGLYRFDNGQLSNFNQSDGLADNDIYDMYGDPTGVMWLGTDGGLSRFEIKANQTIIRNFGLEAGLPDNIVRHLYMGQQGKLWLGTYDGGVCLFDTTSTRVQKICDAWQEGEVTALQGYRDEMWVGTDANGLIALDTASLQIRWQIPRGVVRLLKLDKSGNVWMASSQGGLEYSYPGLRNFYPTDGRESEAILAVATDSLGNIWFSKANGVFYFNPEAPAPKAMPVPLPKTSLQVGITRLAADAEGWIWMGTFEAGIFRHHPPSGRWQHLQAGTELDNGSVLAMAIRDNEMWLSTLTGLSRMQILPGGRLGPNETFDRKTALGINYVLDLIVDTEGKVWVLTDGQGIFIFDHGQFAAVEGDSLFQAARIVALAKDPEVGVWAATANGQIFKGDASVFSFQGMGVESGVMDVFSLAVLPNQRILLLHDQGLTIFDLNEHIRLPFQAELGLEDKKQDLYQQNIAAHRSGSYWVISQLGLHQFWPPDPTERLQAELYLHPISIFLSDQVDTTLHVFGPDEDHLTFSFTGLWYRNPDAVSYAYFLEGYDLGWIQTQDPQVTYPRLGPGSYTFRLRTRMYAQEGMQQEIAYRFRILPPIWRRPWFILLCLAAIGFAGFMLIRIREKRLAERSRLEQEKMRFQFETLRNQVNPHFLFNSFNTLAAIIEDDSDGAIDYVNHLSDLFRSMLNFRERQLISLEEELEVLDTYFYLQQHRYRSNLKLEIDIPEELKEFGLPPLTLQMLIENAIKHNVISKSRPLTIKLEGAKEGYLTVSNPLQPKRTQPPGTRVGLQNIQDRYALISDKAVDIRRGDGFFVVEIPLLKDE